MSKISFPVLSENWVSVLFWSRTASLCFVCYHAVKTYDHFMHIIIRYAGKIVWLSWLTGWNTAFFSSYLIQLELLQTHQQVESVNSLSSTVKIRLT